MRIAFEFRMFPILFPIAINAYGLTSYLAKMLAAYNVVISMRNQSPDGTANLCVKSVFMNIITK